MPQVRSSLIDKLLAAFDPERGALVVIPVMGGKRGNPVVWSRRFFPELMAIEGDVGARNMIARYPEAVAEVPFADTAALVDVDTPEALAEVVAAQKGCAAFAVDGHKPCGPNGYANASRLGAAQNAALKSCYKYGGKDCVIRAWICDGKG